MRPKVAIVGAGRVGESTAQILAMQQLAGEVVLLDVREGVAQGVALDIQESAPLFRFDTRLAGGTDPALMEGADIVVVTAGLPRKPGMSRSDLLDANARVIETIVDQILQHAPTAQILMVTNPVDVLTYLAWRRTRWSRRRVFGLSGVLDAARMAAFIALETGFSIRDIQAMVLGGHGDAMVPMPRYTTVAGVPVDRFLSAEQIERIVERTRHGGAEILALKKTSSANDSPAAAIATMIDAIVHDRRRLLPVVAVLEGEYGLEGLAMGVPAVLERDGMSRVVELELTEEEAAQFRDSAEAVLADIERLTTATRP